MPVAAVAAAEELCSAAVVRCAMCAACSLRRNSRSYSEDAATRFLAEFPVAALLEALAACAPGGEVCAMVQLVLASASSPACGLAG